MTCHFIANVTPEILSYVSVSYIVTSSFDKVCCQKNFIYIYTWEDLLNEFILIFRIKFSMNLIIRILYRFMYKIKFILPRWQCFYTSHVNTHHKYLIISRANILHKINYLLARFNRNFSQFGKIIHSFFYVFYKKYDVFHSSDASQVCNKRSPRYIAWQNLNLEYSIIPPSWHSCMYVCAYIYTYVLQNARVSTTYHSKAELKEGSINDAVVSLEPLHADV